MKLILALFCFSALTLHGQPLTIMGDAAAAYEWHLFIPPGVSLVSLTLAPGISGKALTCTPDKLHCIVAGLNQALISGLIATYQFVSGPGAMWVLPWAQAIAASPMGVRLRDPVYTLALP